MKKMVINSGYNFVHVATAQLLCYLQIEDWFHTQTDNYMDNFHVNMCIMLQHVYSFQQNLNLR